MPEDTDLAERIHAAAKAQPLLQEATTERLRGKYRAAVDKCEEAIAIAPQSAEAHECLGDIHASAGHFKAAVQAYRKAVELDPSREKAEEKLALASLGQLKFEREIEYGSRLLDGKGTAKNLRAASQVATSLSLLCPGLGQAYNGQYLKAALMAAAHLLIILIVVGVFTDTIRDAERDREVTIQFRTRRGPYGPTQSERFQRGLAQSILVMKERGRLGPTIALIVADLCLWGWAIIDAGIGATKREEDYFV